MADSAPPPSAFSDLSALQRALDIARSTEYTELDPAHRDLLERALDEIWERIQANPTTYLLTRDEFAIFNFYQDRWSNDHVAKRAVERFWAVHPA